MECLPLNGNNVGAGLIGTTHAHTLVIPTTTTAATTSATNGTATGTNGAVANGSHAVAAAYHQQHHLNLNHHLNQLHHHHHHLLMSHQSATTTPYSNNYPLQHSSSHHHIHSEQTKSLQELQHEVGALLEFRDLVIETFPDLKHKMASMSSSNSTVSSAAVGAIGGNSVNGQSVSGTNTLTGGMSSSSLASRREWEPGIRTKRKNSQKESTTGIAGAVSSNNNSAVATTGAANVTATGAGAGELSSSSLTRSRSNSHSGKKEPKSGGENNGSVVQDSGFSTETSSSKEGHSASSTNGAMTGPNATNRLSCLESDDELLNLLDVIHRKSNRLREEVEQLQTYERTQLHGGDMIENDHHHTTSTPPIATPTVTKSSSGSGLSGLTPKTFREHVERLNKEDIKQLRKERDRLLDKLAEMEAETLTGRIKAAKMSNQVEELINVKKDLEEQLKLAMAQKLELSSRVQQLQQLQSKSSSSSQSDYSSQRNFSSSATTVLSTVGAMHLDSGIQQQSAVPFQQQQQRRQNTFQPVVVVPTQQHHDEPTTNGQYAFHQSATGSDINNKQKQTLGRLDGIVSTPGARNAKCRVPDSKRFTAILLETSVMELQRHLLTLTVQNQNLMQKLDQSSKSKNHLAKRLDKSKEDVEDLRFQLEKKNIELEGTKAQLRVLELRIHSSTPYSNATIHSSTPSYLLHSQNDYETNRSSASTTLLMSRRGGGGASSVGVGISGTGGINDSSTHSSGLLSTTPSNVTMPPPTSTQISTPSMKAMTHLPMDEMQQHSSSTESAHDHELASGEERSSRLIMSTSVGGIGNSSSFEKRDPTARRYLTSTKPSKIPLPGSKSVSYFGAKPPTGRPSTANSNSSTGRSPNMSAASSKSSLSRSTGNLLYSKSPNSLKRADSAQSIRNALNTSSSSSSTNATNSSNISSANVTIPSTTRVLQNSPLPKLKRDSITSRLRNIESVSRSQYDSNITPTTTPRGGGAKTPTSNYTLVSSTPKSSSITAQINSTLRKDLQLSHSSQQFLRRATGSASSATNSTNATSVTRRFSSASTNGMRTGGSRQESTNTNSTTTTGHADLANSANNGVNSDSDSGKHLVFQNKRLFVNSIKDFTHTKMVNTKAPSIVPPVPPCPAIFENYYNPYFDMHAEKTSSCMSTVMEHGDNDDNYYYENEEDDYNEELAKFNNEYESYDITSSMEEGSDNLLVTFDYGYSDSFDSIDVDNSNLVITSKEFVNAKLCHGLFEMERDRPNSLNNRFECESSEDLWYYTTPKPQTQASVESMAKAFQVHHMEYDDIEVGIDESVLSLSSALPEYDVDDHNYNDDDEGSDTETEMELKRNYRNSFYNETDVEEPDEEQEEFYDSIECS